MERVVMLAGGGPWGFTLTGGKDFGTHLQVMKLTPGGKAMLGGVKERDFILAINKDETKGLTHHQAQQRIRNAGQTLSLKLTSEQPTQGAAAPPPGSQSPPQSGRPRPPAPTVPTQTPPTTQSNTPPKQQVPVHQKPVEMKSAVTQEPEAGPSKIVPDSGLYSGKESTIQSPAFKKITMESPSVLSPKSPNAPPTQPMKNIKLEDGNTTKTSQRPAPPPNVPTNFTATTMKISSTSGPKGQVSVSRPEPPPTVNRPQPPPSPSVLSGTSQSPTSTQPSSSNKLVSRQGVCEACKQPIRGTYSSAMNKVWHPEHFICHHCRCSLSSGTFVFEDDKIFCNNCYENKIAQECFKCKRPIVGPMVNAANRHYHNTCFKCAKCGIDLTTLGGFNMENNNLFCEDCFGDAYGASCFGCGQKIGGNELWVEALDHNWHPHCFVCDGCKCALDGARFFAKFGRPYCGQCC